MRPVRVLLVVDHPVQYTAPQFRRISRDARLDIVVAYCSMRGSELALDPDFGTEVAWDIPLLDGYRWIRSRDLAGRSLRRFTGSLNPDLWRVVRRGRFDVVVCYGYRSASFWIAAAATRVGGAKLVWATDANRIEPRGDRPLDRVKPRIKRVVIPRIFELSDGVLASSTQGLRFLSSMGVPPSRRFLIPYAVDNAYFERGASSSDRSLVRNGWGVPDDAFVALFVGKLAPWKRPGDLVRALARAPSVVAVFAGDGALRAELLSLAEEEGVGERIRFLGFVNQSALPATYRGADCLVLPSGYEPFGLVVNEAFASGVTAIVSDACGAVDDLVRHGSTGLVYPCGEVTTLAEHLRDLAGDVELRERLARGARERIAHWGIEENARSFAEAMISVAGSVS
jgi:glycosyltransferase involved in cell wall biosynthesis